MKNIVYVLSTLLFVTLTTTSLAAWGQAPTEVAEKVGAEKDAKETKDKVAETTGDAPQAKPDKSEQKPTSKSEPSPDADPVKKADAPKAVAAQEEVYLPQSLDEARELLGQGGLKYRDYQEALFTLSLLGDETEKENALSILVRTSADLAKDLEPFARGHDAKSLSLLNARMVLLVEERGDLDDALLFWTQRKDGVLRFLVVADDLNRARFVGVRNQAGKQRALPVILGEMQRIQVKDEYDLTVVVLDAQKNELREYPLGDAIGTVSAKTTNSDDTIALANEKTTEPIAQSSSLLSVTGTSVALLSLVGGVATMAKLTSLDSAREEEGRPLWLGLTVGSAALFVGGISLALLAGD